MIAVEWRDWDGPRDANHHICLRTGVLLHVGMGLLPDNSSARNCAWIVVVRMKHDRGAGEIGTQIIRVVDIDRIDVKVHIPFEPHEGSK